MVDHANRGKNVLYQWYLVATQGPTAVRRARAGSLLFSSMYKRTVMMVITAHLMVGFWEAARLEKREGQRLGMYLIQGFVLAFYAVDAYLFWIAFCGGAARKRISGILRAISGSPSTVRRMGIARIVFTVRVAVVLRTWLWYSPQPLCCECACAGDFFGRLRGAGVHGLHDRPCQCPRLPAVLLSTSPRVPGLPEHQAAQHPHQFRAQHLALPQGTPRAKRMHAVAGVAADTLGLLQVLALGVAFLAVSTVTSVSLLEGSIESSTIIGPTFGDIESFFVDMFVFTVSSENYPDVVGTARPRTWHVLRG